MKFKPAAVLTALVVSGGAGAALFGGTAVDTAFTSQSDQAIGVAGATVNGSVTGGDFSVAGLTPGGPAVAESITFHNLGSTTEEAYVKLGGLQVDRNGVGGVPQGHDLDLTFELPAGGTYPQLLQPGPSSLVVYSGSDSDTTVTPASGDAFYTANLGTLASTGGTWIDVATLAVDASLGEAVYFSLAGAAGNSWNGASVTLPYTVQFQDTAGVDQAVGGHVDNLNSTQQIDDDHQVNPSDN